VTEPHHTDQPAEEAVQVEVRYAETDQMGVVHHAVYPVWFEIARTRLCERTGYHYSEIEELGFRLMVTALTVDYRKPARYGSFVDVKCTIARLATRGITFSYQIESGGQRLATGTTTHVWISVDRGRPCRIPEMLAAPFRKLVGSSDDRPRLRTGGPA
jgi:acyl-CoA thioester hydrolase